MFQRNQLQARNPYRAVRASVFARGLHRAGLLTAATYPVVPAGWPNRETRRAIKQGREFRLSTPWRQVLAAQPHLRTAIKAL